MKGLFYFLLFFASLSYSQTDFKTIGKIEEIELNKEDDNISLIFKDAVTNNFVEVSFKDTDNILNVVYSYAIRTFKEKPEKGFMLQLDYDTLLLIAEKNKMQILVYTNHNPDTYSITRAIEINELNELFGKQILRE